MDWGNAIVRSKVVDATGAVTGIEMDLHLEGDFRKTKKKITWLAQPTTEHSLVDVALLDYDYLITKKKLEENDDLKDFVPPVTEFRSEAYADANVKELKKGDIIQFERKGYYIFDGATGEGDALRLEFIHIPDGKQASLASKHVPWRHPLRRKSLPREEGRRTSNPSQRRPLLSLTLVCRCTRLIKSMARISASRTTMLRCTRWTTCTKRRWRQFDSKS
jgi:hypothetical protein